MKTKTIEIFTFDELSDKAKEKAREWWRNGFEFDPFYDSFLTAAKLLRIEIEDRQIAIVQSKTPFNRYKPNIMWSGFWSPGDGASFTGGYTFASGCSEAIRAEFPQDENLHAIADELTVMQSRLRLLESKTLTGKITQRDNHYVHSNTMDATAYDAEGEELEIAVSDELRDIMRRFADWIYASLEEDYEYQTSDESIADSMEANEYEFDENGGRA